MSLEFERKPIWKPRSEFIEKALRFYISGKTSGAKNALQNKERGGENFSWIMIDIAEVLW